MGSGGNRPRAGGVQRVVRTVGVGLACAVVAGCGGGVVGTPVAELWDPCSLPTEALEGAGVEPGVVDSDTIDNQQFEWRFCTFENDRAFLTIFSTTTSYDAVASDPRSVNAAAIDNLSVPAIQFEIPELSSTPSCYVTVQRDFGAVQFNVSERSTAPSTGEACSTARAVAGALIGAIPG